MNRRSALKLAGGLASCGFVTGVVAGSAASGSAAHPTPTGSGGTPLEPATTTGRTPGFSPLDSLPIRGTREAVVGPDGTTVYVAAVDGFAIVDASEPAAPRLLAERRGLLPDVDGGPLGQIQDVAVDGDELLVVGPAHPDPDAVKAALLYDVSDPGEPRQLAGYRTDYPIHNGALLDGLAYLTANDRVDNPIEIVDLRGEPSVVGRWSPADEDEAWGNVPAGIRPIHDVIVRDGVAICSYWDAGTWLVDVSDPSEPSAIGHVGERSAEELASVEDAGAEGTELPGNHHSSALDGSGRLLAIGREAWDADEDGAGGPGGITLVDVSSPAIPEVLASIAPPTTADRTRAGVWTTAHNFELRDGVLYSAWYQGGVRVHDVSDPRVPREVAAWSRPETTRFWTAQRAEGAVVAASMGTEADDGTAGLYTFPLPGGEAAPAARRSAVDAPTGATPSSPTERDERRVVTATPGMVGFGAAATALGGGVAWLLARRRRR